MFDIGKGVIEMEVNKASPTTRDSVSERKRRLKLQFDSNAKKGGTYTETRIDDWDNSGKNYFILRTVIPVCFPYLAINKDRLLGS